MTGQGDWSRGHEDVARAVPILEVGEREIMTWKQWESVLGCIGLGGFLLCGIALGVVTIIYESLDTGKWHSKIKRNVARFIYSVVFSVIPVIACGALSFSLECMDSKSIEVVDEREEIVESTPIVTLDGTSYISGEFGGSNSLLSGNRVHGSISEDDYYTVMTADGNGGYKKERYLASEVTVLFDSSEEDARVEKVVFIKDKKVTYISSLLLESPIEFPYGQECQYEMRIHIPEGSWGEYQFNVN